MATDSPGAACRTGQHLLFDVHNEQGVMVASWCAWCGTGTYYGDHISDDGRAVGFTPTFRVRIPDGFHRDPATTTERREGNGADGTRQDR